MDFTLCDTKKIKNNNTKLKQLPNFFVKIYITLLFRTFPLILSPRLE